MGSGSALSGKKVKQLPLSRRHPSESPLCVVSGDTLDYGRRHLCVVLTDSE